MGCQFSSQNTGALRDRALLCADIEIGQLNECSKGIIKICCAINYEESRSETVQRSAILWRHGCFHSCAGDYCHNWNSHSRRQIKTHWVQLSKLKGNKRTVNADVFWFFYRKIRNPHWDLLLWQYHDKTSDCCAYVGTVRATVVCR